MRTFALTISLSVLLCHVGRADYILQFSSDGSDIGTNVRVGDTFFVNLFIAQRSATTGLTDSGVFSFGTRTSFSDAVLRANPGEISGAFNPFFSSMTISSGQVDAFGALPSPTPTANAVLLASYSFTALSAGRTDLRFGDLDSGLDDFTLADATIDNPIPTNLDFDLFGPELNRFYSYEVHVTAVPEPSGLALSLAVLTTSLCPLLRRSQRRNATSEHQPD